MKKIILTFFTIVGFINVNAQERAGKVAAGVDGYTLADVFVSGVVSFGSSREGDINSNQFNVSPQIGYFIDDYIAIGVRFGYISTKTEIPSFIDPNATVDIKDSGLNMGVFGRYYFTPENNFSFFGELATGISNTKRETFQDEQKGNGWFINAAPGINYFVSYHFAIEASVGLIGYESFKLDEDNAEDRSSFGIGIDLSDINLGLVYRF